MKISDDGLLQAIWHYQLVKLSSGILDRYVGERYRLTSDDDYGFGKASGIHRIERQKITDKLGKQQIQKRILRLINSGCIDWYYRDLTFLINTKQAKDAFQFARKFWTDKGITDKSNEPVYLSITQFESLKAECLQSLQSEFYSVDFDAIYTNS